MNAIMTKEREEMIRKGGELAIATTNLMLAEIETAKQVEINRLEEAKELEKQALKSQYVTTVAELSEEISTVKNGKEKMLTATQVVKELNIDGLTTTILNKWFVSRNLGYYKRFNCEKKRTFQPNDNFMRYIAEEGYSMTGYTVDGAKVKVMYSWDMIRRINKLYRIDIIEFVENNI